MVIAAWVMDVGSCWLGAFREGDVKQLLNIPDNWKVVALITFGYPASSPLAIQLKEKTGSLQTFKTCVKD
jgi:nitroreductase